MQANLLTRQIVQCQTTIRPAASVIGKLESLELQVPAIIRRLVILQPVNVQFVNRYLLHHGLAVIPDTQRSIAAASPGQPLQIPLLNIQPEFAKQLQARQFKPPASGP